MMDMMISFTIDPTVYEHLSRTVRKIGVPVYLVCKLISMRYEV